MTPLVIEASIDLFDRAEGGLTKEAEAPVYAFHVEPFEKKVVDGVLVDYLGVRIEVDGDPVLRAGRRDVRAVLTFLATYAEDCVRPGSEFYVTAAHQRIGRGVAGEVRQTSGEQSL